ncbi:MAG: cupredoxin domain-containing protein [Hyphomicrobiales bacterium]
MNRTWKVALAAAVLAGAALAVWGCQSAGPTKAQAKEIPVKVTDRGFVPSEVKVHRGDDVTLVFTREVEQTCAVSVVVGDSAIQKDLPLNEPVRVALGKVSQDRIAFACPMRMLQGEVVAR